MKNDFHHTNRSNPASAQPRDTTGQFAAKNEPKAQKTTRTWHLKLMLGFAIAALLAIGALYVQHKIENVGFERGRAYGVQEERNRQEEVNKLRQQLISEITAEKK